MRGDAPEVCTAPAPASFLIDSASAFCGEKEPSFAERVAFSVTTEMLR